MSKITTGLLGFGICFAVGFLLWILPFFFPKQSARILETWEFRRGGRRVVVTAYAEKNSFVPGVYYSFEAVDDSKNNIVEIMTFRHDDLVPINKNGVVFLSDNIGYAFMGWMYAVTTDGGYTWSVWDAKKDLPNWECCNYRLIREINLNSDGTGTMALNPILGRRGEVSALYTINYGQSWSAK